MKEKYYPKFLTLFFFLSAIEGLLTLIGFLSLPPSMEKNAVLFGLSWVRLILVTLILLLSLFFLVISIRGFLNHYWSFTLSKKIHLFCKKHNLYSSSLMILLPLFFFLSFMLFLYSNPVIFPGSSIYQYLFLYTRPLLILGLLFSGQGFIIFTIFEWISASNNREENQKMNRNLFIELSILLFSLIIQSLLWSNYFRNPRDFVYTKIENNLLIFVSLISIILGNSITFIINQTGRYRDTHYEIRNN